MLFNDSVTKTAGGPGHDIVITGQQKKNAILYTIILLLFLTVLHYRDMYANEIIAHNETIGYVESWQDSNRHWCEALNYEL